MGAKYRSPAVAGLKGVVVAVTALLACLIFAGNANATTVNIDNFSQPLNPPLTIVEAGTDKTLLLPQIVGGVLGGQRNVQLTAVGHDDGVSLTATIGFSAGQNAFSLTHASDGTYPLATLTYGNLGAGENLIDGTNDRIRIEFHSNDSVQQSDPSIGLGVLVTVTTSGGTSSLTKDAQNLQGPFFVDFPFSEFSPAASFSQVTNIQVAFNGVRHTPNIDFEVKSIAAVPEPASLLSMALGGALCGLASLWQRKSRLPA